MSLLYLNASSIAVDFAPVIAEAGNTTQAGLPYAAAVYNFDVAQTVTLTLTRDCIAHRQVVPSVNITFLPRPRRARNAIPETTVRNAETAKEIGEIVGAAGGSGLVAAQVSRSSLVLTLAECEPDWYTELGRMQQPIRVSIGDPKYGYYVGAAVLNPLLIYGLSAVHAFIGFMWAKMQRKSIVDGFTFVRFPSISILPMLYLSEPTCMSAVVTIIYADGIGYKTIGAVSLLSTVGLIVFTFFYLRKTWAAHMIPGEKPSQMRAKKRTAVNDDDDVEATEELWRLRLRQLVAWLGFFIDGGVKWKDEPGNKGYCRRHRIIFMDYTGKWYWFITAEVGLAALIGILDGAKLGVGKCHGIIVALIIFLLIFFVAIVALRPYNAPFLLLFSIGVTGVQLWGAVCMAIALFGEDDSWQATAETSSVIGIYLVLGRAIFDIAPKVKQFISMLIKLLCRRPKKRTAAHMDLSERLIEAAHEGGGVDAINAENELEMGLANSQDDFLPEFEDEEPFFFEDTHQDDMYSTLLYGAAAPVAAAGENGEAVEVDLEADDAIFSDRLAGNAVFQQQQQKRQQLRQAQDVVHATVEYQDDVTRKAALDELDDILRAVEDVPQNSRQPRKDGEHHPLDEEDVDAKGKSNAMKALAALGKTRSGGVCASASPPITTSDGTSDAATVHVEPSALDQELNDMLDALEKHEVKPGSLPASNAAAHDDDEEDVVVDLEKLEAADAAVSEELVARRARAITVLGSLGRTTAAGSEEAALSQQPPPAKVSTDPHQEDIHGEEDHHHQDEDLFDDLDAYMEQELEEQEEEEALGSEQQFDGRQPPAEPADSDTVPAMKAPQNPTAADDDVDALERFLEEEMQRQQRGGRDGDDDDGASNSSGESSSRSHSAYGSSSSSSSASIAASNEASEVAEEQEEEDDELLPQHGKKSSTIDTSDVFPGPSASKSSDEGNEGMALQDYDDDLEQYLDSTPPASGLEMTEDEFSAL